MLSALLAVLALAGAPSGTHVDCLQHLPGGALGVTYPLYLTIVDGNVIPGPLGLVELGPEACGALLYASATPAERAAIRRLNPYVNFEQVLGVGLQVALHESEHVALNSPDECQVEKVTRTKIDGLLSALSDPGHAGGTQAFATADDAALPPQYHGC